MEIYNERIFDLLTDLANPDQATDYTIAEDRDGRGTFVRGLAEIEVKDENSALSLLFSGGLARTIATHKLNKRSNRSHSIFTVYLQQRQRSGVSERVVHSKLHLVDLAGSERLKKTMDSADGAIGDEVTRKESMAINQSLTYLEQCVIALARKGQSHIPYRQSKLTSILKDCLGANCNTVMIACMWGEAHHLEETVSTLRLASRMMRVQNETVSVETIDPSALIKKQEKIIRALKQELLMHDALVERTGVAYEPYTPEQQESISQMLERYMDAPEIEEENVLNITNYRQMLEICKQFKKKLSLARTDARLAHEQAYLDSMNAGNRTRGSNTAGAMGGGLGGTSRIDFAADSKIAEGFDPRAPTVGETQGGRGGFSLGVATADARPPNGIEGTSRYEAKAGVRVVSPRGRAMQGGQSPGRGQSKSDYSPERSLDFSESQFGGTSMGGNLALFDGYCRGEGNEIYREFVDTNARAKECRVKSKDLALSVNDAKNLIDRLQQQIADRKASRIEMSRKPTVVKASSKDEIVDEEEFRLTKELKDAKQAYKNCFEQMHRYKSSAVDAQTRAADLKIALATAFSKWSSGSSGKFGPGQQTGSPTGSPGRRLAGGSLFMEDDGGVGGERGAEGGDQLDDQEAFDKLEVERVLANDPESLAFFHAQKTRRANVTQNGSNLKQMQKNKRFA
jgi:kinesin family protein 6/9